MKMQSGQPSWTGATGTGFSTDWTGAEPNKPPKGIINPTYKPRLDRLNPGFNHINGEVAPPYKLQTTHDDLRDSIFASSTRNEGPLAHSSQRVGLDVGPVNQTANVLTTGPVTGFADALTKGGQEGEELVSDYWSPTPACSIGETCTPTCATGFAADALVQQVNDFAGLINPDSMRPVDFIAQANSGMSGMSQDLFSLGSAVGLCSDGVGSEFESLGADTIIKPQTDDLVGISIIGW